MPENLTESEIPFVHVECKETSITASCPRTARSYVMKRFHQQKQLRAKQQQANFRYVSAEQIQRKRKAKKLTENSCSPGNVMDKISLGLMDPFDCLAADTSEMPALMDNPVARRVGEPIINFNVKMGYQSLRTVFRSSIVEPGLLNAILLALTFAIEKDVTSAKFLNYQGEALHWINEQLRDHNRALTPATIGAILLLVGVDARLGNKASVQMHLQGVNQLVQQCDANQILMHDGVRRAIFWQDLFCAVLLGSNRRVSHETFVELAWQRDPLRSSIFEIPPGFVASADLLEPDFLSVVKDIRALQMIRDATDVDHNDAVTIMHLDNHQASIESRLYDLVKDPLRFHNPTLYCCLNAAYICSYMLFTEVWGSSLIPSHLTVRLLEYLQYVPTQQRVGRHWTLFLWLVCLGGTFAQSNPEQPEFGQLLRQHMEAKPSFMGGADLERLLQHFVWSKKTFAKSWTLFLARSGVEGCLTELGSE
ncbi:MAG: hypothetical protein M1820_004321 [Bogoriella megaspora]|nr:MAG: hypothetical protein M1820_004321 [Bogoriella megaspora]